MTTDQKKKALQDAGVKLRSNASDETIEELWEEHSEEIENKESETESAEVEVSDEAPEEAETVEDEAEDKSFDELLFLLLIEENGKTEGEAKKLIEQNEWIVSQGREKGNMALRGTAMALDSAAASNPVEKSDSMTEFRRYLAEHGTKHEGSKTPKVFEWADKNLPKSEFNELYAGRKVGGRVIQAK